MSQQTLGKQELEVLNFIGNNEPLSVREVAESFSKTHGLARTTVLTVMDRLRGKGFLRRKKSKGIYQYSTKVPQSQLHRDQIKDFIQKNLGGYLSPLVSYLSEDVDLDENDLNELKRLIKKYDKKGLK